MVTTIAPFTKRFQDIVQDYASSAQAASQTPLDFNIGSVFLALAEATAGNADWLQKLYLFALSVERLATSQGPWVDTWTADYMPPVPGTTSPRLPSTSATGLVTFSRNTPQSQAIIAVGTLVATFDGSQTFKVYADTTNSAYNATIIPGGAYVIPAGVVGIGVPVSALNLGSAGNVLAKTITLIQSSVFGVDTVTNPAPFITGLDPETDAQLKLRFPLYIQSLRAATEGAIGYAVLSLRQGLQYSIHENVDPNGATDYGNVTVYVDDGSGNPPTTTVQNAATAVNAIRAGGVRAQVLGATILNANVVLSIQTAAGYYHPTIVAAVADAVGVYINSLGLEVELPFTELSHVAYNASAGVINVNGITINGTTADLIPGMGQTVKANSVVVS
jgi:uncharacterized phage protein gp47/JayE